MTRPDPRNHRRADGRFQRVTTVADGRVAFRGINVTVASCDRCGFRSALTECLCDHWHECSDGYYAPECDAVGWEA